MFSPPFLLADSKKAPPPRAGLLRSIPEERPGGGDRSHPLILVKRQHGELVNEDRGNAGRLRMLVTKKGRHLLVTWVSKGPPVVRGEAWYPRGWFWLSPLMHT